MTLIEQCKCEDGCNLRPSFAQELLRDMEIEDAEMQAVFTGEYPTPTIEKVAEATLRARNATDALYITEIVSRKLDGLQKGELLDLLLCVEVGADYHKNLSFADKVEGLFTEDGTLGECMHMHDNVRFAVRGYVAVRLCFH